MQKDYQMINSITNADNSRMNAEASTSGSSLAPNSVHVRVNENLQEIKQHGSDDYPVGIYRINVKERHMEIVPWHWHKEMEFIYIIEGCGEFLAGDNSFFLYEKQALLINSEVLHSFHIADGYDNCIFISVVFNSDFLIHHTQTSLYAKYIYPITQNANLRVFPLVNMSDELQNEIKVITDIYTLNKQEAFGFELMTRDFLSHVWLTIFKQLEEPQKLFSSTSEKATMDELRAKEAIHYIEEHYVDNISLEEIAESIHLSKSECCRCIKRCINMTPFEYLMRFRVLKSAQTLATSDKKIPIGELALSVGFNSSSYFNKTFRKYMGCTPSQYKKRMQD